MPPSFVFVRPRCNLPCMTIRPATTRHGRVYSFPRESQGKTSSPSGLISLPRKVGAGKSGSCRRRCRGISRAAPRGGKFILRVLGTYSLPVSFLFPAFAVSRLTFLFFANGRPVTTYGATFSHPSPLPPLIFHALHSRGRLRGEDEGRFPLHVTPFIAVAPPELRRRSARRRTRWSHVLFVPVAPSA